MTLNNNNLILVDVYNGREMSEDSDTYTFEKCEPGMVHSHEDDLDYKPSIKMVLNKNLIEYAKYVEIPVIDNFKIVKTEKIKYSRMNDAPRRVPHYIITGTSSNIPAIKLGYNNGVYMLADKWDGDITNFYENI